MPSKKKLPDFDSDNAAEDFVDSADLTEYDLSGFVVSPIAFADGERQSSISLPTTLVDEVRVRAEREGLTADQFIRDALERAMQVPLPA